MTKSEPKRNRQIPKVEERGDQGVFNNCNKEVKGGSSRRGSVVNESDSEP